MNTLTCKDCAYYYKVEGERFTRCQYHDPWPAPCEEDDYESEEETDDYT